jgi:hypothetical protein
VLARQLADYFRDCRPKCWNFRGSGTKYEVLFNWAEDDGIRAGTYALILYESSPAWVDPDTGAITQLRIMGSLQNKDCQCFFK